jgi:methylated-DNA-[protein]-cysteine S-methyltransferase
MERFCSTIHSPIGLITIIADENTVNSITFSNKPMDVIGLEDNELSKLAAKELTEYFNGERNSFSFPIEQNGTDFQKTVWNELLNIDFGNTLSYLQLSQQMQNPLAIRAIAAANGKNKLNIVVPCHRVIGSNGSLVGYGGELFRKKWLLEHEKKIAGKGQTVLEF